MKAPVSLVISLQQVKQVSLLLHSWDTMLYTLSLDHGSELERMSSGPLGKHPGD